MSEEYKKKLLKYFFQCILFEGSKILLFACIFFWLDLFVEFLVTLVMTILLRTNGGGLHFKRYISCLLFSFLVFITCIFLGLYVQFSNMVAVIILIISIFVCYRTVPIVSANRPPASEKLIRKSKRNTTLVLFIYLILLCIFPVNRHLNIGTWNIIIHMSQLIMAIFLRKEP